MFKEQFNYNLNIINLSYVSVKIFVVKYLQRLGAAAKEMEYGEEDGNFDTVIVNDDLDTAYQNLKDFLIESFEELNK